MDLSQLAFDWKSILEMPSGGEHLTPESSAPVRRSAREKVFFVAARQAKVMLTALCFAQ